MKFRWIASAWVSGAWILAVGVPFTALFVRFGSAKLWDPEVLRVARLTAFQAGASTLLSLLLGLSLGFAASRLGTGAAGRWGRALLALPFSTPTVVVGMAGVLWLGRNGILAQLGLPVDLAYSLQAVIIAHVALNAPWVGLLSSHAIEQVPRSQIEAARLLGASAWRVFLFVQWPYLVRALGAAAAQVFGLCVMSFALVLLLGGGLGVETLETLIYARIRLSGLDLSGALSCAFWELLLTWIPWLLLLIARSRMPPLPAAEGSARRPARGWPVALGICALPVVPYLALISRSQWSGLFNEPLLEPLGVSLRLAVTVSLLSVGTAACAVSWVVGRPWVAALLSLPSGVSALVLGLGFWIAYGAWIDPFEGSFAAIAGLQATLFFPVAFRMLWPLAGSMRRLQLEAARTLGAGPLRAFYYAEWPRWRPVVFSALALSAAASLGEVGAVSLFYSENLVPLPLLITRWMSQYRFEAAQGLASLLFLICSVPSLVIALKKEGA